MEACASGFQVRGISADVLRRLHSSSGVKGISDNHPRIEVTSIVGASEKPWSTIMSGHLLVQRFNGKAASISGRRGLFRRTSCPANHLVNQRTSLKCLVFRSWQLDPDCNVASAWGRRTIFCETHRALCDNQTSRSSRRGAFRKTAARCCIKSGQKGPRTVNAQEIISDAPQPWRCCLISNAQGKPGWRRPCSMEDQPVAGQALLAGRKNPAGATGGNAPARTAGCFPRRRISRFIRSSRSHNAARAISAKAQPVR